jgi:hypothetical protein
VERGAGHDASLQGRRVEIDEAPFLDALELEPRGAAVVAVDLAADGRDPGVARDGQLEGRFFVAAGRTVQARVTRRGARRPSARFMGFARGD